MRKYVNLGLRILVAVLFVQTLYFKFTGAEESIYIFTKAGLEPYGRYGIGVLEFLASILLLVPRTVWAGAILSISLISGAIILHLTKLGIEVQGDGGGLFYTALLILVLSLVILWFARKTIPFVSKPRS